MSERSILSLRYTPVTKLRTLRAGVNGFLKYIQYRDQHEREESDPELAKLLKYVHHRDRTAPRGRLFAAHGRAGDLERRQLEAHVVRSVRGLEPRQQRDAQGRLVDRQRAVYQVVLSPEHADGLDLQRLVRTMMADLEREVGHELPPWLAAEHRNTAHPHVHIVMAARRELEPGSYRTFVITRQRLALMKESVAREIERQRQMERVRDGRSPVPQHVVEAEERDLRPERRVERRPARRRGGGRRDPVRQQEIRERLRQRARQIGPPSPRISHVLRRLALAYHREAEREAEREREEREWS